MAAISIANCTVSTESALSGAMLIKIVTPATADDGDTIDASTVLPGTIVSTSCQGATDGILFAATSAAKVITIPGATDNEARTIFVLLTR